MGRDRPRGFDRLIQALACPVKTAEVSTRSKTKWPADTSRAGHAPQRDAVELLEVRQIQARYLGTAGAVDLT